MISANEPFGGGLEGADAAADVVLAGNFGAGAALVVADEVGLGVSVGLGVGLGSAGLELMVGAGFDTALDAGDESDGLVASVDFIAAGLFAPLLSGLGGRGSWSSALRLTPPPTFPLGGGACRRAIGFRSSFLGAGAETGGAGA